MMDASASMPDAADLVQKPSEYWIEPIADVRALPSDSDPSQRAMLKQSIRLAFITALQKLAPKQRAAVLLIDVLGFSAAETLETSVAAVTAPCNAHGQRSAVALCGRAPIFRTFSRCW